MVYLRTNAGTNGSTMISSLITILHLLKNFTLILPNWQKFPIFTNPEFQKTGGRMGLFACELFLRTHPLP